MGVWGRERVLYVLYVMLEHYITTHTSYSLLAMKWIFFFFISATLHSLTHCHLTLRKKSLVLKIQENKIQGTLSMYSARKCTPKTCLN